MKMPPFESSCQGKQRLGEHKARRAARCLNDRQFEPVHAYPCAYCKNHHVGFHDDSIEDDAALNELPNPDPVSISLEGLRQWAWAVRNHDNTNIAETLANSEVIEMPVTQKSESFERLQDTG